MHLAALCRDGDGCATSSGWIIHHLSGWRGGDIFVPCVHTVDTHTYIYIYIYIYTDIYVDITI
ncbi:hypothetical protein I7I53_07480 [Histoplasma capsulatum var. duboisii H88]|uniref:Uncharacterized protein n=1 Tax=Ajellomyces capsulatus (strain H88) TaxID=544711 RepID=A0A8A1LH74_AJEC8|nr:hypothetical protein I7I53_07480 [Histoplasma capsulatum var. duboisii H88]